MPADEAPDDNNESIRQSYNFAPGYHGLVYRADVPDHGAGKPKDDNETEDTDALHKVDGSMTATTRYKLQAMRWGLIPFWTKRSPDYGSMMRTINARDDSLAQNGGMWNTMKQKKRCIVVCEGFYEWLKKNNGREKIPHFIKRKDGQMMCFAGLWDCVKYEGQEEKVYTYTIITTDSNKQISWLHDRMPVILDPGSEVVKTWLDPGRATWTKELQSILKPYTGELEIYPVDRAVGKVGNNSPSFVVPVDSKENKKNIANFFGNQKKQAETKTELARVEKTEDEVEKSKGEIKQDEEEDRETKIKIESTETNAPLRKPKEESEDAFARGVKREPEEDADESSPKKMARVDEAEASQGSQAQRQTRSSTRNGTSAKSPSKGDGSQKITSFFGK